MPNRWESSERPLFVKTIYVNGSRHAVLSRHDPLVQSNSLLSKKHSRPNSSSSFESTFSDNSGQSQKLNSDINIRISRKKNFHQVNDISSELQSCFVKLRFTSNARENEEKTESDKRNFQRNRKHHKLQTKTFLKKAQKNWNICNKHVMPVYYKKEIQKNFIPDQENDSIHCCFYDSREDDSENNVCILNLKPNLSQFSLNCGCGKNWFNSENSFCFNDSIQISQNEILNNVPTSPESMDEALNPKTENIAYAITSLDPCELFWKNYVSRSLNTSLSERVFQWMDLANRHRTQEEKRLILDGEITINSSERICAGNAFVGENRRRKYLEIKKKYIKNKNVKVSFVNQSESSVQTGTSDEDIEAEVKGEKDVETVLLIRGSLNKNSECFDENKSDAADAESIDDDYRISFRKKLNTPRENESIMASIPVKVDPNLNPPINLHNSVVSTLELEHLNIKEIDFTARETRTKNLFEDDKLSSKKKEWNEQHGSVSEKFVSFNNSDVIKDKKDCKLKLINSSHKRILNAKNKNCEYFYTNDNNFKILHCKNEKHTTESMSVGDKCKDKIVEKNHIKNTNSNDSATPVQQNNVFGMEKNVWQADNSFGRPQLHIFIPLIPVKEPSEDSISECESLLS